MKNINLNFVFCMIVLISFLSFFNSILIYFYISIFLSFLIHPIVKYISLKFNFNRKISIFIIMLLVIISLLLFLTSYIPILLEQLKTLINNIQLYITNNKYLYDNISYKFNKYGFIIKDIEKIASNIINYIYNLLLTCTLKILSFSKKILYMIIVCILTLYFLIDYDMIIKKILNLFGENNRIILNNIINKSNKLIWEYVKYKTIISLTMSIITFLILKFLKSEYVLLLSILTFFLDYIPYFGSIFSGIMIFIVVLLSTNLSKAILAIVTIIVIQQIEGNIITPQIQGKSLGIHPIIILFTLLACDQIWGAIGMFIAIPVAIIIKIILYEFFKIKDE